MSLMDFREGNNPLLITVELHRHGASNFVVYHNGNRKEDGQIGGGEHIEEHNCMFESLQWTHSTTTPYENLSMTMRFRGNEGDGHYQNEMKGPRNSVAGLPIPQINDWLILRTFQRQDANSKPVAQTVFFARVHSVSGHHTADQSTGFVDKSSVSVQAEGFFDFLSKTNVCVGFMQTQGTLYNHKDWKMLTADLLQDMFSADIQGIIGTRFRRLFRAVSKVRLPRTINGNKYIGDTVKVVYNQSLSNRASGGVYRRNVEPVPGYRLNGVNSLDVSRGTALDLLLGSFLADPSLMEIFPSIEFGYEPGDKSKVNTVLGRGTSLKPQLCLIVRMKPWRPEPVQSYSFRHASLVTKVSKLMAGSYSDQEFKDKVKQTAIDIAKNEYGPLPEGVTGTLTDSHIEQAQTQIFNEISDIGPNLRKGMFNKATWPESKNAIGSEKMHFIEPSEIFSLTYQQSDAAHVNTVTASVLRAPNSQLEFASSFMGLPFTNSLDVEEFGVRYYRPEWPFTHIKFQKGSSNLEIDERSFVRTVAAAALQIHAAGSRFYTGQLTVHYRPDLRAGMCFKAGHELVGFNTVNDFQQEALSPGGLSQGGQLVGYMEKVTHRISSGEGGRIVAETIVQYTRGLFNENIPPNGVSAEDRVRPGYSLNNTWHQRYIGFTKAQRTGQVALSVQDLED